MPTMPERMATVEANLATASSDVSEIKRDVKTLLRWYDEERGARKQRQFSVKQIGAGLTVLTFVINLAFKAVS